MPCGYCNNAFVDDELSHDNDLSYHGIKLVDNTFRVFFRSGDKRKVGFLFEAYDGGRFYRIGAFFPSYCPFCGRLLAENFINSVKE